MASWDELFADERHRERIPETAVYRFADMVRTAFQAQDRLKFWDCGCGAGRHTLALARLGMDVCATDGAPRAVELTQSWLRSQSLAGEVCRADMSESPWPPNTFHGVVSWNVLHHNRLAAIRKAVADIYNCLVPGGMLLCTIKSKKADLYGSGQQVEPDTFLLGDGKESGVLHHYFDELGVRELFADWEFMIFAHQLITYVERPNKFYEYTPFPFTNWGIVVKKPQQWSRIS